ncbi:MAG: trehalase family glycosidase [Acidobacteriota bacterium]
MLRRAGICILLAALAAAYASECALLPEIRQYIKKSWTTLRRSNADLLASASDTKVGQSGKVILYTPETLPRDPESIKTPGLLYLPKPYVVPGGRFNEMYGWDSYFIALGLLRDGETALAKDMTDNFVYEVEHYGKVLNANRTYYLTRSQPPFLTRMILDVYRATGDARWLASTLPAIEKYYAYWTSEPHLTPETGLSRYWGGADTPAPEVVHGERDAAGRSHYDRVREYYRTHEVREYDVTRYYDKARDRLTPLFYMGDRAMRESGFDPSSRFGPFSVDIIHYNPVDLNTLLVRMEADTAAIYTLLDRPREARVWSERAARRAAAINRLMWDERAGLYFDYNFERKARSTYRFITTFYPLWAGIASPGQAARVAANLPVFERAGGLMTSDRVTGNQWDAPFGWAPVELIAIEGLRRYGFTDAADRISVNFLSLVLRDFGEHGTIKEKYDVVAGHSDVPAGIRFGYSSNEIGFGWTNAVFLVLYDELSPPAKERFERLCGALSGASGGRARDRKLQREPLGVVGAPRGLAIDPGERQLAVDSIRADELHRLVLDPYGGRGPRPAVVGDQGERGR